MYLKKIILSIFLFLIVLTSCKSIEYQKITSEQAYNMMTTADVIVLDVRTYHEFSSGHIRNAINIPDTEIIYIAKDILLDKNTAILVYCRSGRRSKEASLQLIDMGYTNVYDFGGILDWQYEIVYD